MPVVTRASIAKSNRKDVVVKVDTPVWGKNSCVYVRMLRASEIDEVQKMAKSTKDNIATAMSLVQWCIIGACNENGKPLFENKDKEFLLDQPLVPLRDIFTAIIKLNGIENDGDDAAKN